MNDRFLYNHLDGNSSLLLVLGDFGREATMRFCQNFTDAERKLIQNKLPDHEHFYDEYRHTTLSIVGDLPFLKNEQLKHYNFQMLDSHILVNFPRGMEISDIVPRLSLMALQAMAGPISRGIKRVVVAQPCNTLAPASWQMECLFNASDDLRNLIDDLPIVEKRYLMHIIDEMEEGNLDISFPTVPAAVLQSVENKNYQSIFPIGTLGISKTYYEATSQLSSSLSVIYPSSEHQELILEAIKVSISGKEKDWKLYKKQLSEIISAQCQDIKNNTAIVEACTDLNFGLGLDSNYIYAGYLVDHIYTPYMDNNY